MVVEAIALKIPRFTGKGTVAEIGAVDRNY